MYKFFGGRLSLSENPLQVDPFDRGDQVRTTNITIGGSETGPTLTMESLGRRVQGLNSYRTSEIPMLSDRSPDILNGWYRVVAASSVLNKMTEKTASLQWRITLTRVEGEFALVGIGVTRPNLQDAGSALPGRPTVALPLEAQAPFFRGTVQNVAFTDTADLRVWTVREGDLLRGLRYGLDAEYGHIGQCTLDFDDEPVIGVRPLTNTPESWELSNGRITLRFSEHPGGWSLRVNDLQDFIAWDAADPPARVSVRVNRMLSASVQMQWDTDVYPHGRAGLAFTINRGERFATIHGFGSGGIPFIRVGGGQFNIVANRYIYRVIGGLDIIQVGVADTADVRLTTSGLEFLGGAQVGYVGRLSNASSRLQLHQNWLGSTTPYAKIVATV